MATFNEIAGRAGTISELFYFFWKCKLWWLIPLIALLILFGLLLILAQSTTLAPWMYPLALRP